MSSTMRTVALFAVVVSLVATAPLAAREWTYASGHYKTEANLIAIGDSSVVLMKKNHDLVMVPFKSLSAADLEWLKSDAAAAEAGSAGGDKQVWTTRRGLKIIGKVIDYGRRDMTIQRIRGRIYVNDQLFDNLDGVRREMIPRIVGHFEKQDIEDKKGLEAWLIKQKGEARKFTVEGVLMELQNGDIYGVPFFFFSAADLKVLEPGWQRWLAADNDREKQKQEQFRLEAQAKAYQADQQAQRQMMMMQIQLQGYQAGLFDLWEVQLMPGAGIVGMPMLVVVPGRNSEQAAANAIQMNPGYIAGSVAKVLRRS